jgi:hypothetical protein
MNKSLSAINKPESIGIDRLVGVREAAILLGYPSVQALNQARWDGDLLPPVIKRSRKTFLYRLSDIQKHIASLTAHETTDINHGLTASRPESRPPLNHPPGRGVLK